MIEGTTINILVMMVFLGILSAPIALFLSSSGLFIFMHFKGSCRYIFMTLTIGLLTVPVAIIISIIGIVYITVISSIFCIKKITTVCRRLNRSHQGTTQTDTTFDEPADTEAITVHLVHGTFEKNAAWTLPGSTMRNAIANIRPEVKIARFAWSSSNTPYARTQAAKALADKVKRSTSNKHYIIAHSHGGNIVREMSHTSPDIAEKIRGACLLSTPFIYRKSVTRSAGKLINANVFGFSFALLIPVVALYLALDLNDPVIIALFISPAALLEIWLAKRCRKSYEKESIHENGAILLNNVAIFHAIGDEADSALRFVSVVHEVCFGVLSQLNAASKITREKMNLPFIISYIIFTALIIYEAITSPMSIFTAWNTTFLTGLITVIITHAITIKRAVQEPSNTLAAAAFPIGVFSFWLAAAKAIAYGDWRLIFCPEMFVSSSETPVGEYNILKFAPDGDANMVHSTHSLPTVVLNIVNWLDSSIFDDEV
ncbi:hypothetical protein FVB43_19365 [Erwinia rhapontici]|uniref:hypothetical protein n=1 Tax=Erwinia rhapontici TaxID=55212 RepID=UPI0014382A40|nr:hypothetical protein [Erwinia rhapontici]NKG32191.1 hypothetical protein [Erwinia rhapontici]